MHVFFTNPEPPFLFPDRLMADFADPLHGDYELTVKTITLEPPVKSKPILIGCAGGVT
jgi:hypothetical protein